MIWSNVATITKSRSIFLLLLFVATLQHIYRYHYQQTLEYIFTDSDIGNPVPPKKIGEDEENIIKRGEQLHLTFEGQVDHPIILMIIT